MADSLHGGSAGISGGSRAPRRNLHVNLFLAGTGHHEGSWRHPLADSVGAASADHYIALAVAAEKACLDSIFIADGLCCAIDVEHSMPRNFEPISLLGAIATHTRTIGLIGTMSTTFNEPFNAARQFSSLDHLSNGRAGWNIVTTAEHRAARNFGLPRMPSHEERYGRAAEFLEVAKELWDSWDDRAVLNDVPAGRYADSELIRPVKFQGERFRVAGPLNIARSPQGYPVIVQAGTSEIGQAFAAAHAEVVFSVTYTLAEAQEFYRSFKGKVAAAGRDPSLVKVLPGIVPIIGDTEASAKKRADELNDLIVTARAIAALEERIGFSLAGYSLDEPLPPLPPVDEFPGQRGRYRVIKELAEREKLSIRKIIGRLGGGRGHHTVIGSPEQIADQMEQWFLSEAADGFTVLPPLLPEGLELFAGHVVPELRRRGLMREGYEGHTMRDHYGLPRPSGRAG
ncbi:LLM class flavin-dependent oxidoreductase [Micromonospora sp. WMMA1976]|uniref:LLM class flavin-dependent oxidoreductase n=1 Tax=Micromonospora sp. WMMA1976 TaxID=3014995 RepID=UPI00248D2DC4|nr:LLM class flavin-dependent oxidoreductase [Micromonospora sp. WMMA1976]WBC01097.1 LLM class flavin-dependent oxidoreductase [Micromonospora sp. WMMA1976]